MIRESPLIYISGIESSLFGCQEKIRFFIICERSHLLLDGVDDGEGDVFKLREVLLLTEHSCFAHSKRL